MAPMSKPQKPPTAAEIRRVMADLGRRKSERKATAARENGRKGGRPPKAEASPR
jgi:hypothetical protein